jgi:hypothetical protein
MKRDCFSGTGFGARGGNREIDQIGAIAWIFLDVTAVKRRALLDAETWEVCREIDFGLKI